MMKNEFNPETEINKFQTMDVKKWRDKLTEYNQQDLIAICGVLLISYFYNQKSEINNNK